MGVANLAVPGSDYLLEQRHVFCSVFSSLAGAWALIDPGSRVVVIRNNLYRQCATRRVRPTM